MDSNQSTVEQINKVIGDLKAKVIPDKILMTAIAGHLQASVENNFKTQGAEVPGGWAPLKASTLRQKKKKGLSSKILEARGNLERSIQASSTENESIVSTNLIYAKVHQFGAQIFHHPRTRKMAFRLDKKGELLKQEGHSNLVRFAKKTHKNALRYTISQQSYTVNIPARPFMALTDSFKDKIIDEIKNHITK